MPYKDKEQKRLHDAEYREKNREKIRQQVREYAQTHQEQRQAYLHSEEYIASHRAYNRERNRQRRQHLREQLLDVLGRKCAQCGYNADTRALHIDHVNGGGRQERKSFSSPETYYRYVLRHANNGAYQILCANCNAIKRIEQGEREPML